MLRFVCFLVFALSVVAQAPASNAREEIIRYLESIKPCVLHNVSCPPGPMFEWASISHTVRQVRLYRLPEECKCNTTTEACNRNCYYAFALNMAVQSTRQSLSNPGEIANATQRIREYYEAHVRPCIIDAGNCTGTPIDYSQIANSVAMYVRHYSLPEECEYEAETEADIRMCFYAYMKLTYLNSLPAK